MTSPCENTAKVNPSLVSPQTTFNSADPVSDWPSDWRGETRCRSLLQSVTATRTTVAHMRVCRDLWQFTEFAVL
jgi:hypothetical protein